MELPVASLPVAANRSLADGVSSARGDGSPGSPMVWQEAFREHGPAILAFLSRRLPNRSEAEDLLQETFVRAIRAGNPPPEPNVRAYLFTAARNLLINRHRHHRVVERVEAGSLDQPADDGGLTAHETIADPVASPEARADWSQFRSRLEATLRALSPDLALAFRLGIVERWSYAEIAQKTGWSLPSVKTNVYRARQRVISQLGNEIPELSRA